jgi:hypothetical protein
VMQRLAKGWPFCCATDMCFVTADQVRTIDPSRYSFSVSVPICAISSSGMAIEALLPMADEGQKMV